MWHKQGQSPALEFYNILKGELFMLGLMYIGAASGQQTVWRKQPHLERESQEMQPEGA